MVLDPKEVSLYQIVHDWWGVAAFAIAGYRGYDYLKSIGTKFDSIQLNLQKDINTAKTEMIANTAAIKEGLDKQTVSIVNELRELRQDFRMALIPPRPARASRGKKIVVDSLTDV